MVAIFYFQSEQVELAELPIVTEEVPLTAQPVKAYVQDCIRQLGREAIEQIGAHGGYIGLEPYHTTEYTRTLFSLDPTGRRPTESDAITMSDDWKIPYWFHMDSANDCREGCTFSDMRPPLKRDDGSNSIENQIDRYVDANLRECLNGFSTFSDQAVEITEIGGLKTTTTVGREDVNLFVEYPLEIQSADGTSTISQFSQDFDVKLKRAYDLALDITSKEKKGKFLEAYALHLIGAYSGMDEDKLPPMAGSDMSFKPLFWSESDIEDKLTDIFSVYINIMQVTRTAGFDISAVSFPDDPLRTGLYSFSVLPASDDYFDLDVNLNYLGWPMYLHITDGGRVSPRESITLPLVSAMIPFHRYDVPYDVSFPVMVTIRDPEAFRGKGYSFMFALESNIRNNQAVEGDTVQARIPTDVTGSAPFCEEKQLNSGDVSFRLMDTAGNPVPDATVRFAAQGASCVIGYSQMDGGRAVFSEKFPKGAIGSIIVQHPDYLTYTKEIFRAKDDPQDLGLIKLTGYVTKNVTAKRMDIEKVSAGPFGSAGWHIIPMKHNLKNNERAIIMLEKIPESPFEEEVFAAADISNGGMAEMRLVPGNYTLRVSLVQEGVTVIIPEEEYEEDDEEEEIGPTVIARNEDFMSGNYEVQVRIGNGIYHDNKVEFTALNFNLAGTPRSYLEHDDLGAWSNVQRKAENNKQYIRPVLVD
ncbi:hypothetical protein GF345_02455 [Candidatus Woesearchaeota archaeon]|nr:hypothetical protein [Candidatus Woesearchaeota archaeon]